MGRGEKLNTMRADARACFGAAVRAADPFQALVAHAEASHGIFPREWDSSEGLVTLLGVGKAAHEMGRAVEAILGDRLGGGLLVVPSREENGGVLRKVGSHPHVDEASVECGRALLAFARGLDQGERVVCVLSGGASALAEVPAPGLSWESLRETGRILLESGLAISECNIIRKHLSAFKGGWFAKALSPCQVVCYVLSDVIGDDVSTIGSGPCAPDSTTYRDVLTLVEKENLAQSLPPEVWGHLLAGERGERAETPKPGDPCFAQMDHRIIANNQTALAGAAAEARRRGYRVILDSVPVQGEARTAGASFIARLDELRGSGERTALICGGEPTVTLNLPVGQGGRSQEMALAASFALFGAGDAVFLAGGTDGVDGCVDVAGAVVDGETLACARAAGFVPEKALADHDAYPLLMTTEDLLTQGPTGTNVLDVHILLYDPDAI